MLPGQNKICFYEAFSTTENASLFVPIRPIAYPAYQKFKQKKSRRRTTLPHSNVQYHRREAPYRSCSGWERELQACYVTDNNDKPYGDGRKEIKFPPHWRYDLLLEHFVSCARGEMQVPFSPEYEAKLHDLILQACGIDVR